MYYGGFTYTETYTMPVEYKRWFLNRITQELQRNTGDNGTATRAAHADTPEMRALSGKTRAEVPSRLKRFT